MQTPHRSEFHDFATGEIAPWADRIDRDQHFPDTLIDKIAERGYLAPWLPREHGGRDFDSLTLGLLHEEMGSVCTSTRSLLTAHGMVAYSVSRWGNPTGRTELLRALASGKSIGAFALSEANVGSDAANPETAAQKIRGGYRLDGEKCWITFAQRADIILVLASLDGLPTAFIVRRENPGLTVEPINGMMGARGAMLARLCLDDCRVEETDMLGRPGFGFTMVASSALDLGRYSIAWGCAGLLRACLEATMDYTSVRRQFGTEISNHQLVAQKITQMITAQRNADLLCRHAASLREGKHHNAAQETMIAKYYASTAAMTAASDAVQLHGANGISGDFPVSRLFRDAKIMEIIEGSTQILETTIAGFAQPTIPHVARSRPEAVNE